jgi:hypothetical protein
MTSKDEAFVFPLQAFSRRHSVRTRPERCANAAFFTFGVHNFNDAPKGGQHDYLGRRGHRSV